MHAVLSTNSAIVGVMSDARPTATTDQTWSSIPDFVPDWMRQATFGDDNGDAGDRELLVSPELLLPNGTKHRVHETREQFYPNHSGIYAAAPERVLVNA